MQLLDVTQLASVLNISPKTLYDWVHKEKIPYVKLGHLIRFDCEDIREWIKSRKRMGKYVD